MKEKELFFEVGMKPIEQLIEEGHYDPTVEHSKSYIANIYKDQLKYFEKVGLGKLTSNGVKVTKSLINITKKRLYELRPLSRIKKDIKRRNK